MGLAVDVAGDLRRRPAAASRQPGTGWRWSTSRCGPTTRETRKGCRSLEALHRHDPACTAVLLTGFATVEIAVAALKEYGAWTCLRKEAFRRAEFKDVVRQILSQPVAEDPLAGLTPREREVMALLVRGLPNKGIAHEMVISENTVKRYLKAIFEKLDVDSRAAAVAKVLGTPTAQ